MNEQGPEAGLRPYVPRLLLRWAAEEPATQFKEVDGSIVLVDLSGFTAMSERLARKGKLGAEEVTEVIERLFTQLLAVAYGNGGGLIKFGGDALLLLFTGAGHEAAAARSAHGMRASIREIGRVQTSVGAVTLRMSAGLHSGRFLFVLAGESHRELIVTGGAASTVVAMEKIAQPGQVVVSQATAAALPPAVLGEAVAGGVLLRRSPPGLGTGQEPDRVPAELDLEPYIPRALRHYLVGGDDEPEHRSVSVAFVHVGGVDELEARSPSDAAGALDDVVAAAQAAADRHGTTFLGSDIDADGTKLILAGGAPSRVGDDEERLLHTLLALAEAGLRLPLSIGANRGPVFAGSLGPPYRRTYTVMGDAVNLAARLMGEAAAGQVLATASLLGSSHVFSVDELPPFPVKGKREPVRAYAVRGTRADRAQGADESRELPLVGREAELRVVDEALTAARAGSGGLLEVVGPAGIGKTRLLQEICARADGFTILRAGCELYTSSTPYAPFTILLRQALDVPPAASRAEAAARLRSRAREALPGIDPWLPLLALALDVDVPETQEVAELDPEFRQARLEEVTIDLLRNLLPGPTVLAIEDVHWLDDASSSLLAHVAAEARDAPWLACVTRRDEEAGFVAPDEPQVRSLRPEPLRQDDAEALLVAASEDLPLRPDEVTTLATRGGGNPLFLSELLQAARSAAGIDELPSSIEGMVGIQLDRLTPAERRLVRSASILGTAFEDDVLRELLEDDDADLSPLEGFVTGDGPGRHRFRHALVRDAAYEGLPYRRRRELHARAAAVLEQRAGPEAEAEAEILSLHFLRAGHHQEAWRYALAAGEQARTRFSNADARDFYRRALEAAHGTTVTTAELAGVQEALGDVAEKIGALEESFDAYRAARRVSVDDSVTGGRTYRKQAGIAERLGRFSSALRQLSRGITLVEQAGGGAACENELAELCVAYGSTRFRQGRYRDALRWCTRSLTHAELGGDPAPRARAYHVLDVTHLVLGLASEEPYADRALAIYRELGDLTREASLTVNLGTRAYHEGRWSDAVELYEGARELYWRTGDTVSRADATFNVGEIRSRQGRRGEAEEYLRDAGRVWRAAGDRVGVAYAASELGRLACCTGRPEEGLALLADALDVFRESGAEAEVLESELRRAEGLLYDGEPKRSLELAHELEGKLTGEGGASSARWRSLLRIRACALAQTGDLAAARASLEEAIARGRDGDADLELALSLDRLAALLRLIGERGAGELSKESAAIFEELGIVDYQPVPLT